MIRFLFRFAGLLCLAAAFVFAVYDGMKSIADRLFFITRTEDIWIAVHPASQQSFQSWLAQIGMPWLWDPVTVQILSVPFWLVLLVAGVVLVLLGRKKKPLIGYARS